MVVSSINPHVLIHINCTNYNFFHIYISIINFKLSVNNIITPGTKVDNNIII